MSVLASPAEIGDRALVIAFGVAEVGAAVVSGAAMTAIVVASQLVRAIAVAGDRRPRGGPTSAGRGPSS